MLLFSIYNLFKDNKTIKQLHSILLGSLFNALSWECIHSNAILGSFHFDIQLPAKSENEKTDQDKSQEAAEGEERGGEGEVKSAKKKRKRRDLSAEDGEQPGPSCPQSPVQRRSRRKISYCEFFSPIFLKYIYRYIFSTMIVLYAIKKQIPVYERSPLIQTRGSHCLVSRL